MPKVNNPYKIQYPQKKGLKATIDRFLGKETIDTNAIIEQQKQAQQERLKQEEQQQTQQRQAKQQEEAAKMSEKSNKGVQFLKGGNVKVSVRDKTTGEITTKTLSADEYKRYNESVGGGVKDLSKPTSENVKAILTAEQIAKLPAAFKQDLTQPQPLAPDMQKAGFDAMDTGKIIGGITSGAGTGAAIGSFITPGVGTAIGGAVGGVVGGVGAYFYTQSGDRKENVKVGKTKFNQAKSNMDMIVNEANAGMISPQQARLYWENEYLRVLQAEREIKAQSEGLFGKKLAKNDDELAQIEAFKRYYPVYKMEFENALINPNPALIKQVYANEEENQPV